MRATATSYITKVALPIKSSSPVNGMPMLSNSSTTAPMGNKNKMMPYMPTMHALNTASLTAHWAAPGAHALDAGLKQGIKAKKKDEDQAHFLIGNDKEREQADGGVQNIACFYAEFMANGHDENARKRGAT